MTTLSGRLNAAAGQPLGDDLAYGRQSLVGRTANTSGPCSRSPESRRVRAPQWVRLRAGCPPPRPNRSRHSRARPGSRRRDWRPIRSMGQPGAYREHVGLREPSTSSTFALGHRAKVRGVRSYDVVIIGAGIVAWPVSRELLCRYPRLRLAVLDKERASVSTRPDTTAGASLRLYYALDR